MKSIFHLSLLHAYSTSDVEEVHPAKRTKGLAAVLQHIAEDDNAHSVV